jgi:hypothetical protein
MEALGDAMLIITQGVPALFGETVAGPV